MYKTIVHLKTNDRTIFLTARLTPKSKNAALPSRSRNESRGVCASLKLRGLYVRPPAGGGFLPPPRRLPPPSCDAHRSLRDPRGASRSFFLPRGRRRPRLTDLLRRASPAPSGASKLPRDPRDASANTSRKSPVRQSKEGETPECRRSAGAAESPARSPPQ